MSERRPSPRYQYQCADRRPVTIADDIDEVRRLIEVAKNAMQDPDGASPPGMLAILDVIDDKLSAISEAVLPGGGE